MRLLAKTLILTALLIPAGASASPGGMMVQGSGVARYLGLITVYQATLYAAQGSRVTPEFDPKTSMCLAIRYDVALDAEDFIRAADTVLSRQHERQTLDRVRDRIAMLNDAYAAVREGDEYTLCYHAPTESTTLALNGARRVEVPTAEFAGIYFGIWLGGSNPLDETLRDRLLGLN